MAGQVLALREEINAVNRDEKSKARKVQALTENEPIMRGSIISKLKTRGRKMSAKPFKALSKQLTLLYKAGESHDAVKA